MGIEFLAVIGLFLFMIGMFCLRYFIGEKFFRGRRYITKGYYMLSSRRVDGYILDTIGICLVIIYSVVIYQLAESNQLASWGTCNWVLEVLVVPLLGLIMFITSGFLRKIFSFYNEQGLFISTPFSHIRNTPWGKIKEIRLKKNACFEVLSYQNKVLIRFFLSQKNAPFLDYAESQGVSVRGSKAYKMLYNSNVRLNDTLQEWKHVIAHSSYEINDILAYGVFQDFIVLLFLDRKINENNIIAINSDGSTRWTISEIIPDSKSVSYVAMSVESPETISVLSVLNHQYQGVISTINVHTCQIVSQIDRNEI